MSIQAGSNQTKSTATEHTKDSATIPEREHGPRNYDKTNLSKEVFQISLVDRGYRYDYNSVKKIRCDHHN